MRAHARLVFTAIHAAPNRTVAVIVEHQVRMSPRLAEPVLDFALRLRNGRSHSMLRGRAVGVGRRTGNIPFPFQTLAQLLFRLPNMLSQNVSALSLIAAEITRGTARRTALTAKGGSVSRTS